MPDQEQGLDDVLEALVSAGSSARNPDLLEAVGWDWPPYGKVRTELVARRIVTRGRGLSDTVSLADADNLAQQDTSGKAGRKAKARATARPSMVDQPPLWTNRHGGRTVKGAQGPCVSP